MFKNWRSKINPLLLAVIEDNTELVAQLKDSEWTSQPDNNEFTPLEIAQLLGRVHCQHILNDRATESINIQLKNQKATSKYSINEFEDLFQMSYRQFLTFPSYEILTDVIRNCPWLLRVDWLGSSHDRWETFYQSQLSKGTVASTSIKWIDPHMGYGLFADEDFPEKTFIGEYTGNVRLHQRNHPDTNAYCFRYPTRFLSLKYYVIDSLKTGNVTRFINHSSQPNLQPLWLVNRKLLYLAFITNCFVAKGTQLTFNYGSEYQSVK